MHKGTLSILVSLLLLSGTLSGATIYVPDDYPLIQDAIVMSSNGDTVIVRPGTYQEKIDFLGKAITVTSQLGPYVTGLDGMQTGSIVTFQSGEGNDSVFNGFTVTNGLSTDGTIACLNGSSPAITNNIIMKNTATVYGGAIYCQSLSNPLIAGNTMFRNKAKYGGGIYCHDSSPVVVSNVITNNRVELNGGGIRCWFNSNATITNNTLSGNEAFNTGGGIACDDSKVTVTNTILWDNISPNGPEIYLSYGATADVTYCDVKGGLYGTGNIDADPLFIDPLNRDYHIPFDSPCRSAGSRDAFALPDNDFEGDPRTGLFAFPDIGGDEFHAHLYVNGQVLAGGVVNGVIVGWPQTAPVVLISGRSVRKDAMVTPYGDFWLAPPWDHRIHFDPIPNDGKTLVTRTVSSSLPPGTLIPLQAVVGTELTNLWIVRIL